MSALPCAKVNEEELDYTTFELIETKQMDESSEIVEIEGKITVSF